MSNLISSRMRLMLRIGGALLLALILLLTAAVPSMAKHTGIKISYFYSFIHNEPLITTVDGGQTFTIYDEFGGCGTVYHDTAQVEVDKNGKIRAYNHDCLSGDGPGTYGPWVKKGCSTAEEFGYVVQACVLDDKDD
jgi:hypothetical protein